MALSLNSIRYIELIKNHFMASIEVKKRSGRTVGLIVMFIGLFLTLTITTIIMQKERVKAMNGAETLDPEAHHWSALNWTPMIGVVVLGVGVILFIKSAKK
jgi:hypothetical protein